MPFPLLTERLLIRPFTPDDAQGFHNVLGDPHVMKDIPAGPSPSLEETRQKIMKIMKYQEEHGLSMWAIIEKETGRVIGDCGLILVEGKGPEIELTYDIAWDAWGKGYATEAGRECLRYGFEELGLDRIIAITYPSHAASRRVMEKCGMRYEGCREYYGHEMVVYVMTREELEKRCE